VLKIAIFLEPSLHPQKNRSIFFGESVAAVGYQNILEGFINQLHPNERRIGYFQQDEATAYTVRATLNYLSKYIL
jgi:hypothetical protein